MFPGNTFLFPGFNFFIRDIDGKGNLFPGNTFPFPSIIFFYEIYSQFMAHVSNGTINYSVGASSMLMLASDNLSDTLPRLSPPL